MNNSGGQSSFSGVANSSSRLRLIQTAGTILLALLLLLPARPARADDQDDRYMSIMALVDEADTLNAKGQSAPALAKYKEAQVAIFKLQKEYPNWNLKMLSYREKYLVEKIAAFTEKLAPPAKPTSAASTTASSDAAAASQGQVKLLEAGAEPRKVLRLHPKPGDKQAVSIIAKSSMEVAGQAIKIPGLKLPLEITIKEVSADGTINFDLVMGDAGVVEDADAMPQIVEAMKTSLAGLKGISGNGSMSDRGITKGVEFKMPAGADAQTRQAMEQMRDALAGVVVALPEEAVGTGAKWEVKKPVKTQGMTLDQTATYELVSCDGERLGFKNSIAQSAANQKINSPMMPGVKVDLAKMTGTETGTVTLDLSQVLPAEGSGESHTEMNMSANLGGQKQEMNMKMDAKMKLEAAK